MNDYLDNLITRNLNLGETIRPRPVSMFEPSPPPDQPAWPEDAEVKAVPLCARETAESERTSSQTVPSSPSEIAGWPMPPRPPVTPIPAAAGAKFAPPHAQAGSEAVASPSLPTPKTLAQPFPQHRLQQGDIQERVELAAGLTSQQVVVERVASPAAPSPKPAVVHLPGAPPTTPQSPRSGATAIQPHVRPALRIEPASPAPNLAKAEPQPAPTIQVTIGRVEVRAAASPPQPKQRAARSSAMSLDEYLRKRNGGKP